MAKRRAPGLGRALEEKQIAAGRRDHKAAK
jgi:hypothetical protein